MVVGIEYCSLVWGDVVFGLEEVDCCCGVVVEWVVECDWYWFGE